MISKSLILSCALLAIIFVAYLPVGEAVTCTVEPDNADCVDCDDPINIDDAECIAEDNDGDDDNGNDDDDTATTRRPPRWDRPGRRPGWRRRRHGHRHRHHRRPRTLLGSILDKKLSIISGIKQG